MKDKAPNAMLAGNAPAAPPLPAVSGMVSADNAASCLERLQRAIKERDELRKKVEEQRVKGAEIWAQRCKFLEARDAKSRLISQLEKSIGSAKAEIDALNGTVAELRDDKAFLESRNSKLGKRVEQLEKEELDILGSADYKVGSFLMQPFHLLGRLFKARG